MVQLNIWQNANIASYNKTKFMTYRKILKKDSGYSNSNIVKRTLLTKSQLLGNSIKSVSYHYLSPLYIKPIFSLMSDINSE